jgi:hypothetical protein
LRYLSSFPLLLKKNAFLGRKARVYAFCLCKCCQELNSWQLYLGLLVPLISCAGALFRFKKNENEKEKEKNRKKKLVPRRAISAGHRV